MPRVQLHTGPARSTREARIDEIFHEHAGRALVLVPTAAAAQRRKVALARSGTGTGLWGDRVFEFTHFATALLVGEGFRVHRIDDFERKLLLESCLATIEGEVDFPLRAADGDFAAGTLRHLLRVITQIKQAAIEPQQFLERTRRRDAPADRLVAAAYAAYQDALKTADAYDVPGIYWAAEAVALDHRPALLDGVNALLLDGFDDFTPSQFRFIQALAPHVETLSYGIAHEDSPARNDLFRITRDAVDGIRAAHDITPESHAAPDATHTHEHAAATFLSRDRVPLPDHLADSLDFSAYLDAPHEIEAIGRKIKTLLLGTEVHPTEIAVVYRSLGDSANEIRRSFAEFGIPVAVHHAPPLAQRPLGGFLLRFLRARSTWGREAILDLLSTPWLAASPHAPAFPLLARRAGIVEGRTQWQSRLATLARRIESGKARDIKRLAQELPDPATAVAALLEASARIEELGTAIPDAAPVAVYAEATTALLAALQSDADETPELAELRKLLAVIARADSSGQPIAHAAWLRRLEQGLNETTCPLPRARHGVDVLEASAIRNLDYKHVFFAALNEGILPAAPPGNVLYADGEIDRLRDAGVFLEGRRHHADRERLLFNHVLESASAALHLSWRLANDNGNEASRSPFLIEVLAHFPAAAIDHATEDSFLPLPAAAASLRDLRNGMRHHAPGQSASPEAQDLLAPAAHGARIESERHARAPFAAHDGILDDAIAGRLAEDFGPQHVFSVNQLETYADCPFRFFVQRVLHAEECELPSDTLDPRTRGILLHDALRHFHAAHEGKHPADLPAESIAPSLAAALDATFESFAYALAAFAPSLAAAEKTRLAEVLHRYVDQQRENDDPAWKPTHFEVAFGRTHEGEQVDPASNPDPFSFDTAEGPILLAGRIDRVDQNGESLRLVDYKSSAAPSTRDITSGQSLQLSVYAHAVGGHLFPGFSCEEAIYLPVGRKKVQTSLTGSGRNWPKREENVRAQVDSAIRGARAGHFPPDPANDACTFCGFRDTCRYEKSRTEIKQAANSKET